MLRGHHAAAGGDYLTERLSRVAVAQLHDGDAPVRHSITQLHARIYPRAVSASNQLIKRTHKLN